MLLVFLPGHPPYYAAASVIVAKMYSNSMMAVLNSRVKPVSNASASAAPIWNESVEPVKSINLPGGTQPDFEFRINSPIGIASSRASDIHIALDSDVHA